MMTVAAAVCGLNMIVASPAQGQFVATEDESGTQSFTLYAGQSIDAGSVSAKVEGTTLKVTYTTTGGWELTEAHLWIGNQINDLPQTKSGNPQPGQFTWKSGDITGLTEYTFAIPLSNPNINFSCPGSAIAYYLAAHASVRKANGDGTYQTETGWSAGSPITSKGSWATFSTFTLSCGEGEPTNCETAFAKLDDSSTCFIELGFQRWGWTTPLKIGNYEFNLYAGAGQCDTTKGALAGTVTVNYDGSAATVTFNTTPGWTMQETHLYVGNDRLPLLKQGKNYVETVAPGAYPYQHTNLEAVSTDTYTVSVTGDIYVVAHAVTCK